MIVNAVDPLVVGLAVADAGEYMHVMVFPLQSSGHFSNMNPYTTNGNRVQRLPGKDCDPHNRPPSSTPDQTETRLKIETSITPQA